jgi:dehydrogenase/reductase SDR family protein 12
MSTIWLLGIFFAIMGNAQGFNTWAAVNWYYIAKGSYGAKGFAKASKQFKPSDIGSMKNKVVAITGANRGLGFAAATEFAKLDAEVHLLCRSKAKGEEAANSIKSSTSNSKVFAHVCDASSMESITNFSEAFCGAYDKLDVLVNNAGGMPAEKTLTDDMQHDSIMASALGGVMLLSQRLLPVLRKGSDKGRVINVVSGGGFTVGCPDIADLDFLKQDYNPTLIYAFAKRAQMLLTEMWPVKHPEENVRHYSMHPGWAITEGVNEALEGGRLGLDSTSGFRTAAEGVDTMVFLGSTLSPDVLNHDGTLWFDRQQSKTELTWGTQTNAAEKEKLWNAAIKYIGQDPMQFP